MEHRSAGHGEEEGVFLQPLGVSGMADDIDGAQHAKDRQAEGDPIRKGRVVYHGTSRAKPCARITG